MHRVKIQLDTLTAIQKFVKICTSISSRVYLENEDGKFCVNGKSIIGAMYTMEWDHIYCVSDEDIYHKIREFAIEESNS